MGGTWHRYAPGERWRIAEWKARVVLEVPDHVVVCFNAPVAELMDERAVALHPALQSLGPDLLAPDFDRRSVRPSAVATPTWKSPRRSLDQRVMAGIGNVFKSEILFIESVNPWTPVGGSRRLAAPLAGRHRAAAAARQRHARPPATRHHPRRPDRPRQRYVYGRANEPCTRCGTPIRVAAPGRPQPPDVLVPALPAGTSGAAAYIPASSRIAAYCSSVSGTTDSLPMRTSGLSAKRGSALIWSSRTGRGQPLPGPNVDHDHACRPHFGSGYAVRSTVAQPNRLALVARVIDDADLTLLRRPHIAQRRLDW